jgi:release factor glutamine methyltransferase
LNQKEKEIFDSYISRLNSGEPIEYILEKAEFYGLDFFVDKRVLIPRDDTEIMVEKVLETSPQTSPLQERGQDQILIDV